MSAHTPGPWEIDAYGDVQANGEDIAHVPRHYGVPENEANARLIAAAPELLGALVAMVDSYQHEASISNPALLAARAAIAKATQP